MCHLSGIGRAALYDVPIGHRSRREMYMLLRRARQHPMKMVWARAGLPARFPIAMNMAWTTGATSTSFRALSILTFSSKGDP
jgi:hypothetical protein